MATDVLRIAQLSDTHFLAAGDDAEGGFAYDTDDAFAAVHAHIEERHAQSPLDLIVVTGDVADHGHPAQYQKAAAAFGQLSAPVNVCPGNHDQDVTFTAGMGRPTIGISRALELGNWCFLFVDSNAGAMVADENGRLIDPDNYDDRLHRNGALGEREASWVRDMCATTQADHVFIWLHHPPAVPPGLGEDAAYEAEWADLVPQLPKLRGFGGGHTHVPDEWAFGGLPVFVSPALKNNFDLQAKTMLPPGYRSYEFKADGTVTSNVHLTDDDRWPRQPLGRAVMALMLGEISWGEFEAIVSRKTAERTAEAN